MFNKDTQLCISVAAKPGNFGMTVHNAAYAALGLNFVYKAFGVVDIAGAIAGVRALGIRGCSISMPFKQTVIGHLDALDTTAEVVGAVNTIVNDTGRLTGFNTDVAGAHAALEAVAARPAESVLMLGAGGVAGAILLALRQMGFSQARVACRNHAALERLNRVLSCQPVLWEHREREPVDILINATPIGMSPGIDSMPIQEASIRRSRAVVDVVISPMETKLIRCARLAGKAVAPGYLMSLEQAIAQFVLYTGQVPPRQIMEQSLLRLLGQQAS